ncbi:MAG: hypothetical protein JW774_06230 [Candidatus Aureabacteria bacterium]|nr:hypothetical protein [Candidatus Auribacterota bacterium]
MKKSIILLMVWGFFWIPVSPAADYIQSFGQDSYVNWTKGEICATGSGIIKGKPTNKNKMNAYRAATLDAMRKLTEVINGVYVDSDTKIEKFTVKEDTIRTKVSGIVKNFTEKEIRYLDNGICQVNVSIPINGDGSIAEIFLGGLEMPKIVDNTVSVETVSVKEPTMLAKKPETAPALPGTQDVQEESPVQETGIIEQAAQEVNAETETIQEENIQQDTKKTKEPVLLAMNKAETPPSSETAAPGTTDAVSSENAAASQEGALKNPSTPVSGLVVNASGYSVRPALVPKIVSDTGEEIYGFNKADRNYRKLNGMASYTTTLDDAELDKRVTENPYIVPAVKVDETKPATVVISGEDAKRFKELKGNERILSRCRVIIVSEKIA